MAKRDIIGVVVLSLGFVGVVGGGGYYYLTTRPPDPMQAADDHAAAGKRYLNQANWQMAVEECTAALEIDPDLYATNRVRGEANLMMGHPPGAIRDLTAAINNGFDDAATVLLRAKAYRDDERYDQAQAEFARVAELDPKNREVRGVSGKLLLDLGRYAEALAMLDSQLKLVPSHDAAWRHRGWALWGLGRYDEAVEPFSRSMEEGPENFHGQFGRGMTHIFRRDFDAAIADFEEVAGRQFDRSKRAKFYLFVTRLRTGDRDGALAGLNRSAPPLNRAGEDFWPAPITRFLLGEMTEDEFFERINETGTTPDPNIAVEGWYFAGMMRLIEGDEDGANELFNRSVGTGVLTFYEYHAAVAELRALGVFNESQVTDAALDD